MLAGIRAGGTTFIAFPKLQGLSGCNESGVTLRAIRPLTVAGTALVESLKKTKFNHPSASRLTAQYELPREHQHDCILHPGGASNCVVLDFYNAQA
jgi:hypothetical protein